MSIRNHGDGFALPAEEQVGTEFFQSVRVSLRGADDPLIRTSIPSPTRCSRPEMVRSGTRFRGDGYGEHDDGRAFDGSELRPSLAVADWLSAAITITSSAPVRARCRS
ncbi:MAG: hypothetical protein J2P48_10460 [Alphaproteobacteria bacterium]|nr:hypothetical protein [Alphaproteobacteria bacterium]